MVNIVVIVLVCALVCGAKAEGPIPPLLTIGAIFENHIAGNSHHKLVSIAVELINEDKYILPNTTLIYIKKYSNCNPRYSVEGAIELIHEHHVKGILGCPCSIDSSVASTVTGAFSVPMISISADSFSLSNKDKYPFFMRTVPTNLNEFLATIDVLSFFGWNTLCTIHTEYYSYPKQFFSVAKDREIRIPRNVKVRDSHFERSMEGIKNSGCRVISIIAFRNETKELMLEAEKHNLLEPGYVWILGTDSYLAIQKEFKDTDFLKKMEGSLSISLRAPLNSSLTEIYKQRFNNVSRPHIHDGTEISYDFPNYNRYAQFVPDAIQTLALALHQLYYDNKNLGPDYDGNKTYTYLNGRQLLNAMKAQQFSGISGDISYDENGDRIVPPRLMNVIFHDNKLDLIEISSFDLKHKEDGPDHFELNSESASNNILWRNGESTNLAAYVAKDAAALSSIPEDYVCVVNCSIQGNDTVVIITVVVCVFALVISCGTFVYRRRISKMRIKSQCVFNASQLSGWEPPELETATFRMDSEGLPITEGGTAILQGRLVTLKPLKAGFMDEVGGTALISLLSIRHDKLLGFVGVVCEPNYIILEHASKGTIYEALVDSKIPEEMDLQLSLCRDAAVGLEYLHKINITHDILTLTKLTFTKDFSCKITGFLLKEWANSPADIDAFLFLSPEVLSNFMPSVTFETAGDLSSEVASGVYDRKLADLYSYGLCAFSILSLNPWPWGELIHTDHNFVFQREALRIAIINNKEVPPFSEVMDLWDNDSREMKLLQMIKCSLDRQPSYRPPCQEYNQLLNSMLPNHSTILEGMQAKYMKQLEVVVSERTKQLREEKAETEGILTNVENLISSLLPEHVVDLLAPGISSTVAESHTNVAVGRIQILDYHNIENTLDCVETISLVNAIYKQLDNICIDAGVDHVRHDIGMYVVCSGAFSSCNRPVRNVANFALNALSQVQISHPKTSERILLRCSIAFGHVSSGVIGSNRMAFDIFGAADDEAMELIEEVEGNNVILSLIAAKTIKEDSKFNLCPMTLKNGKQAMLIHALSEKEQENIQNIGSRTNSTIATTNVSGRSSRDKKNKLNALLSMAGLTPKIAKVSESRGGYRKASRRTHRFSLLSTPSDKFSSACSLPSMNNDTMALRNSSCQSSVVDVVIGVHLEEPIVEAVA